MRVSKKGWMVLSTLIIIGIGFSFYFLVYVKQKEAEIIAEKMRVLTQIKTNINLLISSETKVIENQRSALEREVEVIIKEKKGWDSSNILQLDFSEIARIKEFKNIDTVGLGEEIKAALKNNFPGWTFDTAASVNRFELRNDSATWAVNKMFYKKSYADFFGKELILRKDMFESIGIVLFEGTSLTTLFTNHPSGSINFGDSTDAMLNKSIFEWSSSNEQYTVFNSFLEEQDKNQIYVLGFVKQSELNKQKQEVSVFVIITAIILVTLMILGLPLLKLQVMSSAERLGAKDVFLAGASLVVGPTLVILFFLLTTTNNYTDKEKEKDKLTALSENLTKNFKTELEDAIHNLHKVKKEVDLELNKNKDLQEIPKIFPKNYQESVNDNQHIFNNFWNNPIWQNDFPYFNTIFWADGLGNIAIYLSSEKNPRPISSLNHRSYVMDIVRERGIWYNDDIIAFESIRSVTDGNYELGLGIPSKNKAYPVLATSFSSVSLMNPILEEGYGFCLFNSEGRTLFHSEIQRNLNEDFLEETGDVFNPYVSSGTSYFTSVRYMGEDHYMYMQELPDLKGYFLATFSDKSYSQSPNAISLTTTAEMQMGYMLLLFLIYLPLFMVIRRKKKLKQKAFMFYWLRPMSCSKTNCKYNNLLSLNTFSLFYLIVAVIIYKYCIYSPELLLLSVVNTGVFLVVTNFFLLSRFFPKNELIYTQFHKGGNLRPFWIIVACYTAVLFIIRLLVMLSDFHPLKLWDFVALLLIVAWLYRRSQHGLNLSKMGKLLKKMNFGYWDRLQAPGNDQYLSYKLYCTSLILLISIVPCFIFFSMNYNSEQEILFKQKSVSLKEQKGKWRDLKSAQFFKERKGNNESMVDSLGKFIDNMENTYCLSQDLNAGYHFSGSLPIENIVRNTNNYADWYNDIRVEFDEYGTNSQGFIRDEAPTRWSFNGSNITFNTSNPPQTVTASFRSFEDLFFHNLWGMILFLALLALITYMSIGSVIEKIFGLDFKSYARMIRPRDYHEIGKKLIEVYKGADVLNDSFNNSFLVGVNATHVYKIYHQLKAWKKAEFYSIELLELPNLIEAFEKKKIDEDLEYFVSSQLNFQIPILSLVKSSDRNYTPLLEALKDKHLRMNQPPLMVFIEHFEYAYDNVALNNIKLNLLQRLVSNPSIRVVISSEISPTKIFEFYEDHIKKATATGSTSLESMEKINELKCTFKQWQYLLGGFYRITVPFDLNEDVAMPKELMHGQYLNRINSKYNILFKGFKNTDNHILNVQETSYTYYFAIWNSLTKKERYIIYDIAHDEFINTNDVDGIIDLLHKGILVYDYSLRLMNESFTNFVLTKVNSDEALERELESNKKGNWSTASAVLILVIISLIVFISLGNINILQDVNALLASLTAIFAVFLRLGGMFVTGKSKE